MLNSSIDTIKGLFRKSPNRFSNGKYVIAALETRYVLSLYHGSDIESCTAFFCCSVKVVRSLSIRSASGALGRSLLPTEVNEDHIGAGGRKELRGEYLINLHIKFRTQPTYLL